MQKRKPKATGRKATVQRAAHGKTTKHEPTPKSPPPVETLRVGLTVEGRTTQSVQYAIAKVFEFAGSCQTVKAGNWLEEQIKADVPEDTEIGRFAQFTPRWGRDLHNPGNASPWRVARRIASLEKEVANNPRHPLKAAWQAGLHAYVSVFAGDWTPPEYIEFPLSVAKYSECLRAKRADLSGQDTGCYLTFEECRAFLQEPTWDLLDAACVLCGYIPPTWDNGGIETLIGEMARIEADTHEPHTLVDGNLEPFRVHQIRLDDGWDPRPHDLFVALVKRNEAGKLKCTKQRLAPYTWGWNLYQNFQLFAYTADPHDVLQAVTENGLVKSFPKPFCDAMREIPWCHEFLPTEQKVSEVPGGENGDKPAVPTITKKRKKGGRRPPTDQKLRKDARISTMRGQGTPRKDIAQELNISTEDVKRALDRQRHRRVHT